MSDDGRDTVAEGIGSLFSWITDLPGPALLGVVAVAVVATLFYGITRLFPAKTHRWCHGSGHWGIGPFRRRCGGCGGSGLVDR